MSDIQYVPLDKIVFNRFQQSDARNEPKVLEIVSSINQHRDNGTKGLLQVPTARVLTDGTYELAFGHHRFMAFQIAAAADTFFSEMPLIVRDLSDIDMFELMAIENFHRRDISPIEEAKTFHAYMETFQKTSVETAQKFEKTDEYVRASIRLLNLPAPVQQMVTDGQITKTDARDMLVLGKIGGNELIAKAVEEITGDDFDSPKEAIAFALRNNASYFDPKKPWAFATRNFPYKHLRPVTREDLKAWLGLAWLGFRFGTSKAQADESIERLMTLIASGMEIEEEAFPDVEGDSIQFLRVVIHPPKCEACPFQAVLDGKHYCGVKLCMERKTEAWAKKELEDKVNRLGVPLYRKEDGPFLKLDRHDEKHKKLWEEKGADLRLKEAKYEWNNFDGLDEYLCVVIVGETFNKWKEANERKNAKIDAKQARESQEREIEYRKSGLKVQAILNFSWAVASHDFASAFSGVNSLEILKFQFSEINENPDFPEGMDPDEVLKDLDEMKTADALKHMRRVLAYAMIEIYLIRNDIEVDVTEKKPVIKHAKNLEGIAGAWEVKLPKDFMTQAEAYQAELDLQLKEIEPSKAKK